MNSILEDYIVNHIDAEDELLAELNRATHVKILQPRMLSGHLQGKILEMLSKMIRPKNILEIGTFTGYSAICLAKGLVDDGKLFTIEINDELRSFAESFINRSTVKNKIEMLTGDALKIIPSLNIKFDLIFIDGDKREYLEYYKQSLTVLNDGGYIFADNVFWSGKVLEPLSKNDEFTKTILAFNDFVAADTTVEKVILPIRDGLTLIRKKS